MDTRGRYGHHQAHGDANRSPYPDRSPKYPPPEPRERERFWGHPEAHHGEYNSPRGQYGGAYGYDQPDHTRPRYDYPPHTRWDYRDYYNQYGHDPYWGQRRGPDGGQRVSDDSWRYQDRMHEQMHSGYSNSEYYRSDQQTDSPRGHLVDPRETAEASSSTRLPEHSRTPGLSLTSTNTLEYSRTSGLSSSGYELSQYMNGADQSDVVSPSFPPPSSSSDPEPLPVAPLKYAIPHAVVSFGTAGQLLRVSPGLSTKENQLEIHSLEVILGETQEQLDMRKFPGPLTMEDLHKVDAIEFAHQRAAASLRDVTLQDSASAALLWKLLILLCRQNGQIVGSDIAELLLQNPSTEVRSDSQAPMLIDFNEGLAPDTKPCVVGDDLLTGAATHSRAESSRQALQKYTALLLAGRKKEALESAMKTELWGHALFLASKMDNRSYTTVLNRFTSQLTSSDPLQTLFQLLSGKTPTVSTYYGQEKWGDWKPHLAVMLANETADPGVQRRAVVAMGDTLASRGLLHAAHVCYLTAYVHFGFFTQKTDRLVLLGASHRLPFSQFAQNAAIQCTELFEYSQNLGGKIFSIPSFQVYKLLYATRLLDWGLASQAFHYCELIGQSVLRHHEPLLVLTGEVIKLADRLKHWEGQLSDASCGEAPCDPSWLQQLRLRLQGLQMGNDDCMGTYLPPVDGSTSANQDTASTPEADPLYHHEGTEGGGEGEETLGWAGVALQPPPADRETQDWGFQANSPPPPPQPYALPPPPQPYAPPPPPQPYAPPPSAPSGAVDQQLGYHNFDSPQVITPSLAAASEAPPSATGFLPMVPLENVSGEGSAGFQVNGNRDEMAEETASEPADTNQQDGGKAGWFSGWFKSKPKNVQKETSDQAIPSPTASPPPPGSRPGPPPPPGGSYDWARPQPASAGFNLSA